MLKFTVSYYLLPNSPVRTIYLSPPKVQLVHEIFDVKLNEIYLLVSILLATLRMSHSNNPDLMIG